ncbi:hypothetical protein PsYK624_154710 [Phanerochaete sordida]|uniref:Uncharacterized protein n=1 Tax=Phanerochaete sordida TaxID=48140 RepID=A0A9P3LL58_9APHY|nr:hypothetical protein PsYK624_154710 [Phanerochaete sordida]
MALGTLYFAALLAINIAQILKFSNSFFYLEYMTIILQSLPIVLIQRFMLNLRQIDPQATKSSAAAGLSGSRLSFRIPSGFLGNLGEPLEHGAGEELEDETEEENQSGQAQEEHASNWM